MRKASIELLVESLVDALQTMAFICPEPPTGEVLPPVTADYLSIRFNGASSGELQLAAPRAFAELMAINILALEPASAEVTERAIDAVKELCNITAGALLSRLCESPTDAPEMGLPSAGTLADAEAWRRFTGQPGTTILMAEGFPLAIRLEEGSKK